MRKKIKKLSKKLKEKKISKIPMIKKIKAYLFYIRLYPQAVLKAIFFLVTNPKNFLNKIQRVERIVSPVLPENQLSFNFLQFLSPEKIIGVIKILFTQGPKGVIEKIKEKQWQNYHNLSINQQYQIWLKKNYPTKKELEKQKKESKKFKYQPKISLITPVYNPEKKHLIECIESVLNQSYPNWELCLVDDASTKKYVKEVLNNYSKKDKRIKVKFREKNGHICVTSNDALKMAKGGYMGLLDHDDFLWPNALYEVVKLINQKPHVQFIYSDEDKLDYDGKTHIDPFFKPDWSPDYLRSINYITHFAVLKKSLIDKIGGFRVGTEGAQDWDLFLRAIFYLEKNIGHCHPLDKKNPIQHISTILYSWRKTTQSTASEKYASIVKNYAYKNQKKVLEDDLKRRGYKGWVEPTKYLGLWRVRYEIIGNPLVSIIIPTKDKYEYISRCLKSIIKKTTYKNYELIIVDTGSTDKKVWQLYEKIKKIHQNTKVLNWQKHFNFSSVCNFGAEKSRGEYLLFLNNDTEIITPDWIEGMLEHGQRREVGAVGCKLLYKNNNIQHIGLIISKEIGAHHININTSDYIQINQPLNNLNTSIRNISVLSAACLLIKKNLFQNHKFNQNLYQDYNDVFLCLNLLEKKFFNIFTPFSKLYHFESTTFHKKNLQETFKRIYEGKINFFNEIKNYYKLNSIEYFLDDRFFNKNSYEIDINLSNLINFHKNLPNFLENNNYFKNILFITHLYYPSIGGAEKIFQRWAEKLTNLNYKVTVLTTNALSTEDYYKNLNRNLPKIGLINNVLVIRISVNDLKHKILGFFWKIINKFSFTRHTIGPLFFGPQFFPFPKEIKKEKFDYVIAGPTPTSSIFYGLIFSKINKIPFYIFPFIHINDNLHTALINKLFFKKAKKIITTTLSEKKFFLNLGIKYNKIFSAFNPVDKILFEKKQENKQLVKIKDYILYLGQEGRHKNIPLLINAMIDIWNHGYRNKLVIAGQRTDFSYELDNIIKKIAKKYKNKIIRLNNISEEEKINLLDHCLFLVNPSYHESFGLVFLEAWARKKPVIGNSIDAVKNVVNHEKNGLIFKFNNKKDLVRKIEFLIKNKKIREKYGLNGFKKVKNEYNFDNIDFNLLFAK